MPSKMYSSMDRLAIDNSDIVFGYLEADNPTPINTVAELCYGKGKGKTTILCDEWHRDNLANLRTLKPNGDWYKPHYLDMVREWVDFYETDFGRAKELLKWLS